MSDQDAFRIQTVQDVAEALAFLTDQVLVWNEQAIDEHCVRINRFATHLRDALDVDLAAIDIGIVAGVGKFAVVVTVQPVFGVETAGYGAHRTTDRALLIGHIEIHENLLQRWAKGTSITSAWWPRRRSM